MTTSENRVAGELRQDEVFVIRSMAAAVSGQWWHGENPPDAYLKVGKDTVAVEITTLTQHVSDERGGTHARLSRHTGKPPRRCRSIIHSKRFY
jgi:sarcosine oxidase delta subunit